MASSDTEPQQKNQSALSDPIVDALPFAVIVLDERSKVLFVNVAAENLFDTSASVLRGQSFGSIISQGHIVFNLIDKAADKRITVTEEGVNFDTLKFNAQNVTVSVSPYYGSVRDGDQCGTVISLQTKTFAERIDKLRIPRQAVESVSTMAAMLAHEIKNPLASIRGAAQLLTPALSAEDIELTELICDETDRIVGIVDRMDLFRGREPVEYEAVNIHSVLDRVKTLARTGFAATATITERYDPSLPSVWGHSDLLIQAILNLVKNAAESLPSEGGEIQLATRYWHGVSVRAGNGHNMIDVPLEISIRDNGSGIPKDVQNRMFEPFVTSKATGSGLGLALVAKVINDHSGVIEFRSEPGKTEFLIRLPTLKTQLNEANG